LAEGYYGYYEEGRPAKITIDESLRGKIFAETVFHEVMHAVDDIYGVKLTHNQIELIGLGLADALSRYLKF
jgi:hypothetical protein